MAASYILHVPLISPSLWPSSLLQANNQKAPNKLCKNANSSLTSSPPILMPPSASTTLINIHSDTSYLSKANAHSQACSNFSWVGNLTRRIHQAQWCIFNPLLHLTIRRHILEACCKNNETNQCPGRYITKLERGKSTIE